MARKKLAAEQIVTKLRKIEVLLGQGKSIVLACKEAGTMGQNYYRWRKEYGGFGVDQAQRLKQLKSENGGPVPPIASTRNNKNQMWRATAVKKLNLYCVALTKMDGNRSDA